MANIAEMRAQISSANESVNEARTAIRMAQDKIDEAIRMHYITDSVKLAQAIASLQQMKHSLEESMVNSLLAIESADAYAATL